MSRRTQAYCAIKADVPGAGIKGRFCRRVGGFYSRPGRGGEKFPRRESFRIDIIRIFPYIWCLIFEPVATWWREWAHTLHSLTTLTHSLTTLTSFLDYPDFHSLTTLTEVFPCFSSVVRQMPGLNSQSRGTDRISSELLSFMLCLSLCYAVVFMLFCCYYVLLLLCCSVIICVVLCIDCVYCTTATGC